MDITVEERKFSLRSKYDISAPDCRYYAEGSRWPFSNRFKLLSADREQELARIIWRFSFFRDRYDIRLGSGTVYRFWCENLWRVVYAYKGEQAFYRLYQHKGLTYSLFRGDRRVAAIEKNRFVIGNGDRYDIRVNRSENTLLLICMALVLDALDGPHDSTVTVDLGNMAPRQGGSMNHGSQIDFVVLMPPTALNLLRSPGSKSARTVRAGRYRKLTGHTDLPRYFPVARFSFRTRLVPKNGLQVFTGHHDLAYMISPTQGGQSVSFNTVSRCRSTPAGGFSALWYRICQTYSNGASF